VLAAKASNVCPPRAIEVHLAECSAESRRMSDRVPRRPDRRSRGGATYVSIVQDAVDCFFTNSVASSVVCHRNAILLQFFLTISIAREQEYDAGLSPSTSAGAPEQPARKSLIRCRFLIPFLL